LISKPVDSTGRYRDDVMRLWFYSTREDFPKNAVLLYGTSPTITNLQVQPPFFNPPGEEQDYSFNLSTYQNQPVNLEATILNQDSLTIIRTLTSASVSPGSVSMSWDGRAGDGKLAAPGFYTITITATDSLGNQTKAQAVTTIQY
jgi:hypothetical protein